MNKTEFLQALEEGLAGASPDERVAAMQYYTEYFDEAGPEHEGEVLKELGSPQKIAADILGASGEAGGTGWNPPPKPENPPWAVPAPVQNPAGAPPNTGMPPNQAGTPPPYMPQPRPVSTGSDSTLKTVLIVIVLIFLSPLIISVISVLISLLVTLVILFIVPLIVGVSLVAAGIASVVVGGLVAAQAAGTGLVAIGMGILCVGLGLLCFYGGIVLVGRVLPACIRWAWHGLQSLWRKIFKKDAPVQAAPAGPAPVSGPAPAAAPAAPAAPAGPNNQAK